MKTYLIASESYILLNEELNKIIGSSLNVIKYDLRINTLKEVIDEANYFSFTNEEKYIVVRGCNIFKSSKESSEDSSDASKLLEKYLENPSLTSTIIFLTNDMPDKRKKIYKLLEKENNVIMIPSLNKKEMVYKCMDLLKDNKYKCDYETANYIVENSYVNYDIMHHELDKIYTLIKSGNIYIDDLKDVISVSISDNVFNFINSLINGNLKDANNAMRNFETLKIDPAMVIIMLFKELEIYYLLLSGINPLEVQKNFNKQDWQMKNYQMNLNKFTLKELKKIIIRLNDYDYKYKCGLLDKSVILSLLAIELCE